MKEFRSFLSPQIHSFIRYRQASQRWNDSSYKENLMLFDHYCHANDPCATALTQEMLMAGAVSGGRKPTTPAGRGSMW